MHTQSGSREYGLRKIICKEMLVLMLVVDSVSHPELGLHKCSGIHHDAKHPWMLACETQHCDAYEGAQDSVVIFPEWLVTFGILA